MLAMLAVVIAPASFAQVTDFASLSLEELSFVRITSLGRKETTIFDTPAAAAVLTRHDIQRDGATTLAEALRRAPGFHVGRIDAFDYTISARGFNDTTANKLLVLLDGRSVYSTTFSGAQWNFHEMLMEDVDRIELLRGPGASLWGANAMNGVINVISKSAHDTLGSLVSVGHGDQLEYLVGLRHGFKFDDNTAMRVYTKQQKNGDHGAEHHGSSESWTSQLIGARLDWTGSEQRRFSLITEFRETKLNSHSELPLLIPPYVWEMEETKVNRGANVTARWEQPFTSEGELSLFATYDFTDATQIVQGENREAWGFESQLTLRTWENHEIISGFTYRNDRDEMTNSDWIQFANDSASIEFLGAFIQDEITLVPNRLNVTMGTKVERNSFSGWEWQPSLRAIWSPHKSHRIWIGVSRAARTPSRAEDDVTYFAQSAPPSAQFPLPVALTAEGNPEFTSEHVAAFEFGHRFQPRPRFSLDTSVFVNRYEDLRGIEVVPPAFNPQPHPHLRANLIANNSIEGLTYGGEFTARWNASPEWSFEGSATTIKYDLHSTDPIRGAADPTIPGLEGSTPRYELQLNAGWTPRPEWDLSLFMRHVDALAGSSVPAYTGVDARIAWRPRPDWEIEIVGRDLLDDEHPEASISFIGDAVQPISRSVFLRITLRR